MASIAAVTESWSIWPAVTQFNLFSGQMYLRCYQEYLSVCRFLGLCFLPPDCRVQVALDEFISPASRSDFDTAIASACPFTTSLVAFLRVLTLLRRRDQSFAHSHLNCILRKEPIAQELF